MCVSLHRELDLGVFGSEGVRYLCVCSGTRLSVANTFTAGNCKKQTWGFTGETVGWSGSFAVAMGPVLAWHVG